LLGISWVRIHSEEPTGVRKQHSKENGFIEARAALLGEHSKEMQCLRDAHQFDLELLRKRKMEPIEICTKRVNALKRLLEEENELRNFAARMFRKGPEMVLPMTVMVEGGSDIPPVGKARFYLGDSISRFREENTFAPLPLPILKIRHVRHPPRTNVTHRSKSPKFSLEAFSVQIFPSEKTKSQGHHCLCSSSCLVARSINSFRFQLCFADAAPTASLYRPSNAKESPDREWNCSLLDLPD
jgi:hypothetical protein